MVGYALKWFCYTPDNPWLVLIPAPLMAFGLAGLFTLMPSMVADVVDADEHVAVHVGGAAGRDQDVLLLHEMTEVRRLDVRERLAVALGGYERLTVFPSEANFLFVRFDGDVAALDRALRARGVGVRAFGGDGSPGHLRVTVGTPDQNRALLDQLPAAMAEVLV